ncbi:transcription factor c2h2 [Fusarium sporotrichioides]|uniref:Transcription factor c2h2 n=1 Tax=Fusarium sporotrichioides TaxID=5514 RepID=A0A395SDY4_FUSSP|nr:transcription factor c2h2 [Fusarium sporotrichioides]
MAFAYEPPPSPGSKSRVSMPEGFIDEAVHQCTNAFNDISLSMISGRMQVDHDNMVEQQSRFILWAKSLGRDNISAQSLFRDSPETKEIVVKLLQRLKTNLESFLSKHPPTGENEGNIIEDGYSSDSSLGLSDDDELQRNYSEPSTESLLPGNQRIKSIDETISHLYNIASMIERSQYGIPSMNERPQDDDEDEGIGSRSSRLGQRLEQQLQLERLQSYTSDLLEGNFPLLRGFLKNRLIKTVLSRRIRLLYQTGDNTKIKDTMQSAPSQATAGPSSHPDMQELRPYICLFRHCNMPLRQYATKDDWVNHMSSQHAIVWVCQVQGHENYVFQKPAGLETHLLKHHPGIFQTDQISFFTTKSARVVPDLLGILMETEHSRGISACPLCDFDVSISESENQPETSDYEFTDLVIKDAHRKALSHLSGHLETISLESLPTQLQTFHINAKRLICHKKRPPLYGHSKEEEAITWPRRGRLRAVSLDTSDVEIGEVKTIRDKMYEV